MDTATQTRSDNNSMSLLWQKAHEALIDGAWSTARAALDNLIIYHTKRAVEYLPSMQYLEAAEGLSADAEQMMQDRIDRWNHAVYFNAQR